MTLFKHALGLDSVGIVEGLRQSGENAKKKQKQKKSRGEMGLLMTINQALLNDGKVRM